MIQGGKMAKAKSKGSIILEILIVILIAALMFTILYPKKVWDEVEKDTKKCRSNMDKILKAELVYQKYNNTYTDSLPELVDFITKDTTKKVIEDYFYADTALAEEMVKFLTETDDKADLVLKNLFADTLMYTIVRAVDYDSNLARVMLNRLENIENTELVDSIKSRRMTDSTDVRVWKDLSQMFSAYEIYNPIKDDDSLKLVFRRMMPEVTTGSLLDTLYSLNEEWARKIDSSVFYTVENFTKCPTVGREYLVTVIDTSVIKYVNILCPLDSTDIEKSKKDFIRYHFGHTRLKNHGKITETGEKSWTQQ